MIRYLPVSRKFLTAKADKGMLQIAWAELMQIVKKEREQNGRQNGEMAG